MHKITPQHVGISVADLDQAIAWYRDILGFELVSRTLLEHIRCDIAIVRNGDFELELFGHLDTKPVPHERLDPDEDMITQGTKHVCFAVEGLDGFIEEISAKGVKIICGPGTFGDKRFYYICDPFGVLIELNETME